ncbi:redoxin domain-containing protein [Blastococcus sp. KM273129]|uniref:TlpA family protein disulfide reductase n=1 Tax=Blastococcus sp. KM273129 TaxID=2570315 RepID=UPI001F0329C9|nr:redoxin domain-containing protein [Blastococcus sp. KM273129]MCF6735626.1 redoxin domain-containing protein [Blastococcus sp. KM273129]
MSGRRRGLLLVAALLAGFALVVPLALALDRPREEASATAMVGGPAPPLAGTTLDGGHADLAELRGSVVLVNVWASWCAPCREEMPLLVETAGQWGPQGLRLVGIDVNDDDAAAREFLAGVGGTSFPSIVDADGRLAVEWGTTGVPETFVVDRDGTVVARRVGAVSAAWLAEEVLPLLEEA